MDFKLLKSKLDEKNVSKIELISLGGDSTVIEKDDELQDNGKYILIKKDTKEIHLLSNEVYKIIIHQKKHVSPQIAVIDLNRNKY
jgi:hypothetical protein